MAGGVATSRGDLWWTRMVDLCFVAGEAPVCGTGEKAANVGGFGSADFDFLDPSLG